MNADQVLLDLYKQQQCNETRRKMHKIFMLIIVLASTVALAITWYFFTSWVYIAAFSSMIILVVILAILTRFQVMIVSTASYISMLYACFVFVPILWLESGLIGNTPYISLIVLAAALSLFSGKQLKWMLYGYLVVLAILVAYSAYTEISASDDFANLIYIISAYSVAVGLIVIYMSSKQNEFNELNDRFLRSSFKDELTHLYNRKLLDIIIEYQEKMYKKEHANYVFIMFDVDDFKKMNDEHGHVFGDIVLRSIAKCIQDTTRGEDFVVRYGGDEFLVIQTKASNASVQTFIKRIEEKMETSCQMEFPVAASYGYALRSECDTPEDVIKLADERLYEKKAEKKAGH